MEGAAIQHQGNRFRDFAADLVKPELESADRSAHRYMHVISGCRFYRGLPDGSFAAAAAAARGGQDGNGDDEQDHPAHGGRAYPSETVSFGAKTYRNGVKHLSVCPVSEALFSSPPTCWGIVVPTWYRMHRPICPMRPEPGTHGTHGTRPDAYGRPVLRLGAERSPVQIRPPRSIRPSLEPVAAGPGGQPGLPADTLKGGSPVAIASGVGFYGCARAR